MNPTPTKQEVLKAYADYTEKKQEIATLRQKNEQTAIENAAEIAKRLEGIIAKLTTWNSLLANAQNGPEKQKVTQELGGLIQEAKLLQKEALRPESNKLEVIRQYQSLGQKCVPMGQKLKTLVSL